MSTFEISQVSMFSYTLVKIVGNRWTLRSASAFPLVMSSTVGNL